MTASELPASPPTATYTPGRGLPTGVPFGDGSKLVSAQVSAESGRGRGTNTSPDAVSVPSLSPSGGGGGHVRSRRRWDSRSLAKLAEVMPERDRQVLLRIAEHRYLSTHQIQRFDFTDHGSLDSAATTTRRVLRRFGRLGLVKALDRRVGGSRRGSAVNIWQITPPAARLLRDDGATWRGHEPSPRFLQHCLAIGDVHLGLRALQDKPTVQFVNVQLEPAAWRRHTGMGGEPRWLQPDLAATVTSSQWVDRWFIEVDLGTESLPTLLRKCGQYETYRASGIEQADHGVFPLVLWFFTKPQRAERLAQAVARSPRLTPALYRYASPETLTQVLTEASS